MTASTELALSAPPDVDRRERMGQWIDRHSGRLMVLPAVLILLAFAIFPLIISAYLSLSRFALAAGGFKLTFIGFYNYARLFLGAQQYHFLGAFKPYGTLEWALLALFIVLMAALLIRYAADTPFPEFRPVMRWCTDAVVAPADGIR